MSDLTVGKNFELPSTVEALKKMEAIKAFQKMVKAQLKKGEDYGSFPGVLKESLFKSGAEKLLSIIGVYPIVREKRVTESTQTIGEKEVPYFEFSYILQACDANQIPRGEATGSCNSLEKKYCKSKDKGFIDDPIHYYSQKNTLDKMAYKRACVALALIVASLSNIFTQDIEDIVDDENKSQNTKQYTQSNQAMTDVINVPLDQPQKPDDPVTPAQQKYIKTMLDDSKPALKTMLLKEFDGVCYYSGTGVIIFNGTKTKAIKAIEKAKKLMIEYAKESLQDNNNMFNGGK